MNMYAMATPNVASARETEEGASTAEYLAANAVRRERQ